MSAFIKSAVNMTTLTSKRWYPNQIFNLFQRWDKIVIQLRWGSSNQQNLSYNGIKYTSWYELLSCTEMEMPLQRDLPHWLYCSCRLTIPDGNDENVIKVTCTFLCKMVGGYTMIAVDMQSSRISQQTTRLRSSSEHKHGWATTLPNRHLGPVSI